MIRLPSLSKADARLSDNGFLLLYVNNTLQPCARIAAGIAIYSGASQPKQSPSRLVLLACAANHRGNARPRQLANAVWLQKLDHSVDLLRIAYDLYD